MICSMPGFPVLHHLLEFAQTLCPSSQWCHPAISSSVLPFYSCLQSFPASGSFLWVGSSHQVAKVLELQFQHQSFQRVFGKRQIVFFLVYSPRHFNYLPLDWSTNWCGHFKAPSCCQLMLPCTPCSASDLFSSPQFPFFLSNVLYMHSYSFTLLRPASFT